jgi:aerobic-type carbon monoxide dehydrogenase small subunit (CoxS/CutS family)
MTTSATTTFTFDGAPITFLPGQSIGAALAAHGLTTLRRTRVGHRPRGLFCGIGICFDCLVVVDGRPGQRACLVPACSGLTVETQNGTGH